MLALRSQDQIRDQGAFMTSSRFNGIGALATSCLALASPLCLASGFQILEQSTSRLGTAYAGTASIADDATTAFFNPAGMARLDKAEAAIAGHLLVIDSEFDDRGSLAAAGTPLQQPLTGPPGATDDPGVAGGLFVVQPISERWTFGLGISAPFGLISEYDDDAVVRYHATRSELTVVNFNPSVAFAVTDELSLGFGLNYQRAEVKLNNAVDSFSVCVGGGGTVPACAAAHGGPANAVADSQSNIDGDDDAIVADLSLHWQPSENTALGLVWRQGAEFDLSGDASFSLSENCAADPFCAGSLQSLQGPIRADAELPDTLTASVSHRIRDRWTVHGDLAWTQWSSLQRVEIVNSDNGREVSRLELNYDDTFRAAAGASFQATDHLQWRFGVAFDQAPQDDPQFVTPRIPDADRVWISAGFNYRFGPDASMDLGYAHLFVDDSSIDSMEQGNRLTGRFDNTVDILGLQFNWRY
ncbi:MAG: fatty acid transporter [Ahrensia sp.]|nr:fatty acid transporter [Ahrensia sp.]